MKPTRLPVLLAVAVVVGAVVWLLAPHYYPSLPQLPVYAPVTLLVLGVAEGYAAWAVRSRLHGRLRRSRPIEPIAVARAAALARASSLVGALAAGGYLGLLGYLLHSFGADAPGSDNVVAGFGAGAALLLTVTALLLERSCRVPPRDDDDPRDDD